MKVEKILTILFALVALCLICYNNLTKVEDTQPTDTTAQDATQEVQEKIIPTFGITFDEFKTAFEKRIAEHNVIQIKETATKKDTDKKTEIIYFGHSVILSLDTDLQTNVITKAVVSCQPPKNNKLAIDIMTKELLAIYIVSIEILNPNMQGHEVKEIIHYLTLSADNHHQTISYGDKNYSADVFNGIVFYGIEPNEKAKTKTKIKNEKVPAPNTQFNNQNTTDTEVLREY